MVKNNILGNTIRRARMNKNLTQEGLAEIVGITTIHLKHIEGGQGNPSVNVLFKLAKTLDFSIDSIVAEEDFQNTDVNNITLKSDINYLLNKLDVYELTLTLDIIKSILKNAPDKKPQA